MILTHLVMFKFFDGAGTAAEPPVIPAFNNAVQNWLSPTPHLVLLLGITLYATSRLSP